MASELRVTIVTSVLDNPFSSARLYTFVDTGYLDGRDPVDLARQLCDGGADVIQLRAKGWSIEDTVRLAERLIPVCERAKVPFVVNDHAAVALKVGAIGLHLGQEDFFDAGYRKCSEVFSGVGDGLSKTRPRIGLSTHAPEQALKACEASPAYIAIGPVYPTATKLGRPGVGTEYVRWAAKNVTDIPWFAIGGINLETLDSVLEAGGSRICVVSAILKSRDIARACRSFRERIV